MSEKKALVGMSGGVDSSVAALLAQKQGYECIGATLRLWAGKDDAPPGSRTCCSLEDVEDARAVAFRLGMPYYVLDDTDAFRREVVDYFVAAYESGLTPNPCLRCNKRLKFGTLLDRALLLGCTKVATGHYARLAPDGSGRTLLYRAADAHKDQSYFLAGLDQRQLSHALFPLGELTKAEAREIAEAHGLLNARKRDSQDICFVPGGDYAAFLEGYTGRHYPPGDYLSLTGEVLGRHRGAVRYTVGQRKGLGLAMGAPVYVCGKDMAANTVTVGPNAALYAPALLSDSWNFIPFDTLDAPLRVTAKLRSTQPPQNATLYPLEGGQVRAVFDAPQRAIAPGQAIVAYQGDLVIGSGTILSAESR